MGLAETFDAVRPAIVAFVSRPALRSGLNQARSAPILGTGFFVSRTGLVATNRQVIGELEKRAPSSGAGSASAAALVFLAANREGEAPSGGAAFVELEKWWVLDWFAGSDTWYGEPVPDLALVQLRVTETPSLPLAEEPDTLRVGLSIATAGFPAHETSPLPYERISELAPMLRRGIISGLYPFPSRRPHGFSVDIMTRGGESGSPIFFEDAPVAIGIAGAGFDRTNATIALPSHLLAAALAAFSEASRHETGGFPPLRSLIRPKVEGRPEFN